MGSFDKPYRIKEVLALCVHLQRLEARSENWGITELMRMAVQQEPSDETAVILCRLLFRSRSGEPRRRPARGQPGFFGGTTEADWPFEPVHLFRGVPFYIVSGWCIAGCPESATHYLADCLRNGAWNTERYSEMGDHELRAITNDFVEGGPWKHPLESHEVDFFFSQIE
jgi:hypothetical protein